MTWAIRTGALAAAAAALLTSQAVYAAPVASAGMDPLVALSALATVQSNGEVCAAGATAAAAGAAAAQAGAPGCVLPVTGAPAPVPVEGAVVPPPPPPLGVAAAAPKAIGALPLTLGLLAVIGLAAALMAGGGKNGKGDLTPVSPA